MQLIRFLFLHPASWQSVCGGIHIDIVRTSMWAVWFRFITTHSSPGKWYNYL